MPAPTPFVHHLAIFASNFEASEAFYTTVLAPLGITKNHQADGVAEYWDRASDLLSVSVERADSPADVTRGLHLAFAASDRSLVDAFYQAALASGGTARHAPRVWPEYRAYCAFVSDPDGNNIEAVRKGGLAE